MTNFSECQLDRLPFTVVDLIQYDRQTPRRSRHVPVNVSAHSPAYQLPRQVISSSPNKRDHPKCSASVRALEIGLTGVKEPFKANTKEIGHPRLHPPTFKDPRDSPEIRPHQA